MKYYIVALIDEQSTKNIIDVQKSIGRKYRLYRYNNNVYISLGSVVTSDFDKLNEVISKILHPYKKFKVGIENSLILSDDFSTVNLKVEDRGYINTIARHMYDAFTLNGFTIKEPINEKCFPLPLASSNNSIKKASSSGITIDHSKDKDDFFSFVKVTKIEVWKQLNNKKDNVIKSFTLRDY